MQTQINKSGFREVYAGVGALALWGLVAFANFYSPEPVAEPQALPLSSRQLSRSFQGAAAKLRGRTVDFVLTSDPSETPGTKIGSGVVIDPRGIVLTTQSVLKHAGEVRVLLPDGQLVDFENGQRQAGSQLATVRLNISAELSAARVADASHLQPGDWVVAVSSDSSGQVIVKPGTIHSVRPSAISPEEQLLVTDAAVNPGLEGTPLLNLAGSVIGLICVEETANSNADMGTAVSLQRDAPWFASQLMSEPNPSEATLGFSVQPVSPEVVVRCKLGSNQGVQVTRVIPNTPGTEAGLQIGDVVVALGEHQINSPEELHSALDSLSPGVRKPLEIVRDGWRMTTQFTLPAASFE